MITVEILGSIVRAGPLAVPFGRMLSPSLFVVIGSFALLHHPYPWPQHTQTPQQCSSPIPPATLDAPPEEGEEVSGGLPLRRQPGVRMLTTAVAAHRPGQSISLLAADAVARPLGAQKRLRALADKVTSLEPSATVETLDALLRVENLQPHNFTTLLLQVKKKQKWRQAALIAEWAERPECTVQLHTKHYNLLISACTRRAPQKALAMLRRLLERGMETNAVTHNTAMSAALALDDADAALGLFEEMSLLGISPTTISYNTAIHACAQTSDAERALDLFREMKAVGVERSTVTYTGLIRACAEGGQLDKAMALFTYMEVAGVERNPVTYCVAINACTRNGQWELGLQLLHEMARKGIRPDTQVFNAAISACEKGRASETALKLLAQMRAMGCQPTAVTYGAAISACEKGMDHRNALALLAQMPADKVRIWPHPLLAARTHLSRLLSSLHTCVRACVRACAQVKPNTIVYSAAISACGASGEWESALELFAEMERSRIPRNTISFNAAIAACAKGKAWEPAVALFEKMAAEGVPRDRVTYNSVVRACERGGEYKLAFDLRMESASALGAPEEQM